MFKSFVVLLLDLTFTCYICFLLTLILHLCIIYYIFRQRFVVPFFPFSILFRCFYIFFYSDFSVSFTCFSHIILVFLKVFQSSPFSFFLFPSYITVFFFLFLILLFYLSLLSLLSFRKICRIYFFSWRSEHDVIYHSETLIGCHALTITSCQVPQNTPLCPPVSLH